MQEVEVNGVRYRIDGKIGSGYTSEVFRAVSPRGEVVCVKAIHAHFYGDPLGQQLINNEIAILQRLRHANILRFHKKEGRERLMIVTEYCPDGNLFDYLRAKRTLSEADALPFLRGIARGCAHMSALNILHRDLKLENIFLTGKEVKIADFGFAVEASNAKLMNINVGSPLYMPYEALQDKKFSHKSDVFAIGVIWHELLTGKTPFEANSEAELKEKMKNSVFRFKELKCSKKTADLIFKCLSFRMEHRPTMQQLSAALQEMAMPQKEKSKTTYESLVFKKSEKENVSSKPTTAKEATRLKTAVSKTAETTTGTRLERCKTNLTAKEDKNPFKEYIQTNLSKSRKKSQQELKGKTAKDTVADKSEEEKSTQSFMEYLQRLEKLSLPFLPLSVQAKFNTLLILYRSLLAHKDLPKEGSGAEKDEMLSVLATCTREAQFCRCCLGFVRRLMRLAKSYTEWPTCLKQLGPLWERVERESNAK